MSAQKAFETPSWAHSPKPLARPTATPCVASEPAKGCGFCGKHRGTACAACHGVNQWPPEQRAERLAAVLASKGEP
jgi:hypothetical protein